MRDSEIIDLYWVRDEAAVGASADKYGGYCYCISHNILHSHEDAEECVNDTWLGAWRAMPPRRPECLSAFFGKITRNLALDRCRKYTAEKRGQGQTALALSELEECLPAGADTEQLADERLLADAISAFLRAQPEQRRGIFIRRYWYLFSIRDIAAAYGMSESKTASLLFRMRKDLKAHLEREGIIL